jgi:hypothetical protein
MVNDGSRRLPAIASWAEVDPARYPFDPVDVPVVVRTMVPAPPPRPAWREGRSVGGPEALAWVDAVGVALSERYGPWAACWYWTPGQCDRLGSITDRMPTPAEAPAFVADSLLVWRRWLETVAERLDRFLPVLDPVQAARSGDVVAAWEAAIAQVMMTVIAPIVDDDGWQGWCRRVLQWLLTAAGVPAEQAQALVDGAVDERFDYWVPPTAAVVGEVAERLARDVLGSVGMVPVARTDSWPDTWPQDWPS